jgi:hypothetical protein
MANETSVAAPAAAAPAAEATPASSVPPPHFTCSVQQWHAADSCKLC